MRRILIVLLVLLVPVGIVAAETIDDQVDYNAGIAAFADGVAATLPLNASVGLNWSDAYIGQFPHFGVGATLGFSTIPYPAALPVLTAAKLDTVISSSPAFEYIELIGMPLPAYTVEARIGGLLFPFDAGVKLGILPPDFKPGEFVKGLNLDYTLAGFDIRLPIVKESGIIPEVILGGGYNYLEATIGFEGIYGENLIIDSFEAGGETITLELTDPSVEFFWSASVIDLKAQVSKNILLFRPYAGVGASVGFGRAGSGFESEFVSPPTQAQIDLFNAAGGSGEELSEIGDGTFYVSSAMPPGWAFRAFGGVSINLLIVNIDITGMYDFLGQNYGLTLGARVQL